MVEERDQQREGGEGERKNESKRVEKMKLLLDGESVASLQGSFAYRKTEKERRFFSFFFL